MGFSAACLYVWLIWLLISLAGPICYVDLNDCFKDCIYEERRYYLPHLTFFDFDMFQTW